MNQQTTLRLVFWAGLILFLGWDYVRSPQVDLRFEAPLLAAGSGQASAGGHCALAK